MNANTKIVPVVPTEAMIEAGDAKVDIDISAHGIWNAMLAAAPSAVIDEAMVDRAARAMFAPPISNDRMNDVRAGLKAALEKTQ